MFLAKFGSYNFPIYEFNFPSESNELENKSFTGSTDSLYENVAPLSRSKTDQTERNYKTHGTSKNQKKSSNQQIFYTSFIT